MARVLVIHSSLTVRVLLELDLAQLGHEIAAEDSTSVDVAIVEVSDARSVARTRVLRERDPDLPIIAVTQDDLTDGSHAQTAAHPLTPYSLADLQRAIGCVSSATRV